MLGILLISSLATSVIGSAVMLVMLYLPRAWSAEVYSVLGALGSAVTGTLDNRSRQLGFLLFYLGGLVFAIIYGLIALFLLTVGGEEGIMQADRRWGLPIPIDVVFPMLGVAIGLAHGGIVALLFTIVAVEHHPLEHYQNNFSLVLPILLGHPVFGAVVMISHYHLMRAMLGS